jgi:hypothetical protein
MGDYGHGNHWVSKDEEERKKGKPSGPDKDVDYDPEDPYTTRPKSKENDGFGRKYKRKGWFGIF